MAKHVRRLRVRHIKIVYAQCVQLTYINICKGRPMRQYTQEQQIPYLRYTSTLNLYTLIGSCMNKNVQMHLQIPQGLFPICEVTRSLESGLEGNARIDAINPELGSDVAFQDRSKTVQDGPIDLGFLMVLNGNQKLV